MKTSMKILLGVLALIVAFILAGFFLPSEITLERSRTMDAPMEMVYDQVNNLYEWEHWSPWHQIDTAMGITYANYGIGKGASYSWSSEHKQVGNGTMTITDAKEFEYIDTEMDFGENGIGTAGFKFASVDGKVLVSWDMKSEAGKGPIARWIGLLMKGMIEKSYDQGLAAIDAHCQSLIGSNWYYVKLKDKGAWTYYGLSSKQVTMESMDKVMSDSYSKLGIGLGKAGIEIKGVPFAIYHSWGEAYDMECAMSVMDNSKAIKGLEKNTLPARKYATLKHVGSYDGIEKAHSYLMEWLETSQMELAGSVIELYKTGPQSEPDESKWLTYILYPVQ